MLLDGAHCRVAEMVAVPREWVGCFSYLPALGKGASEKERIDLNYFAPTNPLFAAANVASARDEILSLRYTLFK